MIPPASAQKWVMRSMAALLPITLMGVGVEAPQVQASQSKSSPVPGLPDGTYLYSDASEPNQISHQYILFQHRDGQVVGAFYSPRSEFACFAGEMRGTRLALEVAVTGEPRPVVASTSLSGLNSLGALSPRDQQILSVCQRSEVARVSSSGRSGLPD